MTTKTDARTISGLVLPWDSPGFTSGGRLKVKAGAVTYPDDLKQIKLLRDHSNTQGYSPVGYATAAESRDDGLHMTFRIGETADGDVALKDVSEGIRDALSVELIQIQTEGDTITAGHLTAVALVAIPAFASARVVTPASTDDMAVVFSHDDCHLTAAADLDATEDQDDDETPAPTVTVDGKTMSYTAAADYLKNLESTDDDTAAAEPITEKETEMPNQTSTNQTSTDLTAARAPRGLEINQKPALTFSQAVETIQHMRMGTAPADMTAALADIKRSANPAVSAPEWLGKLWDGTEYKRKVVPTFTQKTLSRMKAHGWRWNKKPEVQDYAGDKAEIPTGTVSTEAVEADVKRLAAGHDIDRAYFDFQETEFLQAFFEARVNDYALKTDIKAAEFAVAEAKKGTKLKTGKEPDLLHAAARARMVVEQRVHVSPDTYLISPNSMFGLFKITQLDNPAYLDLLGVSPDKFVVTDHVPDNKLIAYPKSALTWFELPGSPIRVDAENIAKGGIDSAVFGYWAALASHPDAVVEVEFGGTAEAGAGESDTEES